MTETTTISNAEYLAFLVLGITFIIVLYFIKKLNLMEETADVTPGEAVPRQAMGHVHNPFVMQLKDESKASMTDGVQLLITSQIPCWIKVFWGVKIEDVYPVIHAAWHEFAHQFSTDDFLQHMSLQSKEYFEAEPFSNKIYHLHPSEGRDSTKEPVELGAPPRDRYPMVVMIASLEAVHTPAEDLSDLHQIVSVSTIFHVKDKHCPGETRILGHYIRTPTGKPCNLMQLYLSTEDRASGTLEPEPVSSSVCVVCQNAPVQRTILPCRHACVCHDCFHHLTLCPICRGYIDSYFTIAHRDTDRGT